MEMIDSLTAARLQMTVSLAFHMVFAAIGIGLPLLMVIVEGAVSADRASRTTSSSPRSGRR